MSPDQGVGPVRVLSDAAWPDVVAGCLVLVPLGSLEQHGPHLPLDTDTVIACAVAERAGALLGDGVEVAPALAYGCSGEHQAFPGTVSIGRDALHHVLVEMVRSLRTWADRVVFVNAHGGNVAGLSSAVTQMTDEGHDVGWVPCAAHGVDAHAGFTETSLMMHLRPRSVRPHLAEAGNTTPLPDLLPTLVRRGVRAVSDSGVLGDPTGATAGEGRRLLGAMTLDVARAVRAGRAGANGMLCVPEAISS